MAQRLRVIHTEAGNATVGSGDRHGTGEDDDAGSEIYLLPLNDKGICAKGVFLNLDWLCSGVPVAAEITTRQVRSGGQRSYTKYSGYNLRSELAFSGRLGTTAE